MNNEKLSGTAILLFTITVFVLILQYFEIRHLEQLIESGISFAPQMVEQQKLAPYPPVMTQIEGRVGQVEGRAVTLSVQDSGTAKNVTVLFGDLTTFEGGKLSDIKVGTVLDVNTDTSIFGSATPHVLRAVIKKG